MSKLKDAVADAENVVSLMGHNSRAMTPFEESEAEINDLYDEAKLWLDGEPVSSQDHCNDLSRLMDMLRQAGKRADDRRAAEASPFDEGKKAVQAKYAPLIADTKTMKGKVTLGVEACKQAMRPFMEEQDRQKRAAEAEARRLADEKAAAAQAAIRTAPVDDLAKREAAEALIADAKRAEADARRASNDRAQAHGGSRAASLRTSYEADITDMTAFARWARSNRREEVDEFFNVLAKRLIVAGNRGIPGVEAKEVRSVV